ncbi:MAG: GNAT family N-acetyltransferase, partial [Candidatus Binatia bacterium]
TAALRREGKLFLRYLSLDGAIIAIAICMCEGKKIYYFLPTFDVQYHELTPGKVLLYHILGEAFEMGCDEVDLGPGTHDYKWSWTKDKRTVHYVVVFRGDWHVWLKDSALPQLRRQGKLMMKRFFPGWVQS